MADKSLALSGPRVSARAIARSGEWPSTTDRQSPPSAWHRTASLLTDLSRDPCCRPLTHELEVRLGRRRPMWIGQKPMSRDGGKLTPRWPLSWASTTISTAVRPEPISAIGASGSRPFNGARRPGTGYVAVSCRGLLKSQSVVRGAGFPVARTDAIRDDSDGHSRFVTRIASRPRSILGQDR